ncbi:AimR family lysis-lysogeny pheromone receptor [Cytobacillus gottheilii]|uniref:AimR family lysis-lysogeny pheromone receptor n=1 Tax=Cytobacillus gottheilii TaxID=859144 RepID=UPI0009BB22A8|nr:AimR family lysis-lysogeny pheromone receptor [Cytobacillus gottheilii]
MSKLTLKQMMLNEIEAAPRGLAEELAKIAGYSSGTNFTRTLKDPDKDIEKLDGFFKVALHLFPNEYEELLKNFVDEINPKRITARLCLEYLTLYHMYELKEALLNRMLTSNSRDVIDFASVYHVQHLYEMKKLDFSDAICKLNSYSNSKPEVKSFAKISQIYCYYAIRDITMLKLQLDELESEISNIKNAFIRNSYMGRLFRIKVDISFHSGNIGDLLEQIFILDKALDPTKSMTYLQIGNSYMLKSFDKAMEFYKKALECKNNKTEQQIKQSINFISCLWNKVDNFCSDGTMSNDLFYYARTNNKAMAEDILDNIDFEKLNNHQKAFNHYYRGILENNKYHFYKSIEFFNKAGEKFYKLIPIMELKKLGENEVILEALSA